MHLHKGYKCRGMCKVDLLDAGLVRNAARFVNVDSKLRSIWDQVSDVGPTIKVHVVYAA